MLKAKTLRAWHAVYTRCFLKDKKVLFWVKGPWKAVATGTLKSPSERVSSESDLGKGISSKRQNLK